MGVTFTHANCVLSIAPPESLKNHTRNSHLKSLDSIKQIDPIELIRQISFETVNSNLTTCRYFVKYSS